MSDTTDLLMKQAEAVNNLYIAASREGTNSVVQTLRFIISMCRDEGSQAEATLGRIEEELSRFERRNGDYGNTRQERNTVEDSRND